MRTAITKQTLKDFIQEATQLHNKVDMDAYEVVIYQVTAKLLESLTAEVEKQGVPFTLALLLGKLDHMIDVEASIEEDDEFYYYIHRYDTFFVENSPVKFFKEIKVSKSFADTEDGKALKVVSERNFTVPPTRETVHFPKKKEEAKSDGS